MQKNGQQLQRDQQCATHPAGRSKKEEAPHTLGGLLSCSTCSNDQSRRIHSAVLLKLESVPGTENGCEVRTVHDAVTIEVGSCVVRAEDGQEQTDVTTVNGVVTVQVAGARLANGIT